MQYRIILLRALYLTNENRQLLFALYAISKERSLNSVINFKYAYNEMKWLWINQKENKIKKLHNLKSKPQKVKYEKVNVYAFVKNEKKFDNCKIDL